MTGSTYSGKTSLIESFASQGYRTTPETAIEIIGELNQKYGVEGQIKWRKQN